MYCDFAFDQAFFISFFSNLSLALNNMLEKIDIVANVTAILKVQNGPVLVRLEKIVFKSSCVHLCTFPPYLRIYVL